MNMRRSNKPQIIIMKTSILLLNTLFLSVLTFTAMAVFAEDKENKLEVDHDQVHGWNQFADRIYELHKWRINRVKTIKKVSSGGYDQMENFYQQENFYHVENGQLLSRIKWEADNLDKIHEIELFIYDANGKLIVDYLAAYLPVTRNAPIQTLINFHHYEQYLHGFRQFDADGERIYEQCKGVYFGRDLFLYLDDDAIPYGEPDFEDPLDNEAYHSCFGFLVTEVGELINPLNAKKYLTDSAEIIETAIVVPSELLVLNKAVNENLDSEDAFTKRGIYYFNKQEFPKAIDDLTRALKLKPGYDDALYWRGLAYGRNKQIALGIADLSSYLVKNPSDSLAWTKRGVRYIWQGDLIKAKKDLLKAVEIDATNSEAHDDLGVIYAQEKQYQNALKHFALSLKHDPSYQKAWHNTAMVHFLHGDHDRAMKFVNKSLNLQHTKDSMLLKSLILEATGFRDEANNTRAAAQALPDSNWNESFSIQ